MVRSAAWLALALSLPAFPASRDDLAREIEAYAKSAMSQWEIPGAAVAVVLDGRPVMVEGLGMRELGGTARMDADTVFTIASLTKAFTAMAAAVEVDRGRIAWDQPIVKTLPYFRLHDPYMTAEASFRDLLCHRVGTLNHYDNGLALTRTQMIERVAFDRPLVPFRSSHVYNNILYAAAGEAVANAAGTSWEEHVSRTVLQPLGMTSSSTSAFDLARAPNHSSSHIRGRDGVLRVDEIRPQGWWSMDNHAPAGAINSTARDMAKWLEFQLGDGTFRGVRIVSEAGLRETHRAQTVYHERYYEPFEPFAYALGWELVHYRDEMLLWHTGLFRGQGSVAILAPARKLGVFVFVNSRDSDYGLVHAAIAQRIVDRVLGFPRQDWAAQSRREYEKSLELSARDHLALLARPDRIVPAAARLQDYVGTYRNTERGEFEARVDAGVLRIERLGTSEPYFATMEHWNGESYRPTWNETNPDYEPGQLVSFTLDAHGAVRSLLMYKRAYGQQQVVEFMREPGS
jgi:CubicO group peptidase (beta-lactamase class C family)